MRARRDLLIVAAVAMGVLVALLSLPSPQSEMPERTNAFVVTNVLLFDGEQFSRSVDVWVANGRVKAVGADLVLPMEVPRIDGSGHTLLPGLIDAHTHVYGTALRDALGFGVTTELDMFSPVIQVQQARITRDNLAPASGADLFSAGTLVTAPGGHGTQFGVPIPTLATEDDAAAFVADRIAEGSDFIKIVLEDGHEFGIEWQTLSDESLRAVISAAQDHGLPAVVHVSTLDRARQALLAGADGLVHLFADKRVDDEFLALMQEKGAFVVPTLSVLVSFAGGDERWKTDDRILNRLNAAQRQSLSSRFPFEGKPDTIAAENLRALYEAGVPLLAGTDAPNPGTAHGVSMHLELQLMVEAGMPISAALTAATSSASRFFPLARRGRIAPGARADMLLVEGDLSQDVSRSLNLVTIWKNGHVIGAEEVVETPTTATDMNTAAISGPISSFESDLSAQTGVGWRVSTDAMRGGKSTAHNQWINGGADESGGAMQIEGVVEPGFAWPWSGAVYFPGEVPMTPRAVLPGSMLTFSAKGDGAQYQVLLLSDAATPPVRYPFVANESWQTVTVPLSQAPTIEETGLAGIVFSAGPMLGPYEFQIDNVAIERH